MHWKLETPLRVSQVRCSGALQLMPAGGAMGGAPHLISTAPDASVRREICGGEHPPGAGVAGDGGGAVGGLGICDGPPVPGGEAGAGFERGAGGAGAPGVGVGKDVDVGGRGIEGGGGMPGCGGSCGIAAPAAEMFGSSGMSP
jgi:hypothetical protein